MSRIRQGKKAITRIEMPAHQPKAERRSQTREAFTLIELLVVVAILAVLAGILVPAVSTALRKGNSAKCMANVRQVATAVFTHASDNDRRLPAMTVGTSPVPLAFGNVGGTNGTENAQEWGGTTAFEERPLFNYISDLGVFECPSDLGDAGERWPSVFSALGTSYLYPMRDVVNNAGIEGLVEYDRASRTFRGRRVTAFNSPSKKVIVHEITIYNNRSTQRDAQWHTGRHAGMMGFLDGHAALVDSAGYTDLPRDADNPRAVEATRTYY